MVEEINKELNKNIEWWWQAWTAGRGIGKWFTKALVSTVTLAGNRRN